MFQPVKARLTNLRGDHKHHIIGVGKFTLDALSAQDLGDFRAVIAHGLGLDGQLQGLRAHDAPARQPGLHGFVICRKLRQFRPVGARQNGIGGIQGLHDQVGRTGGAKEGQGRLGLPDQMLMLPRNVQIGAARQDRQGLVSRICAQIRPQIHGVPGGGQEFQVCAVGVIHQQQAPVAMGHLGQCCHVGDVAQIIGARHVDRRGAFRFDHFFKGLGVDLAGEVRVACDPGHVHIQQGHRTEEDLVGVPPGGNLRTLALGTGVLHGEVHHGPDGERRPLRRVKSGASEKFGCIFLALADDARRFVEAVGAGDFGDIVLLHPQPAPALVTGHVETENVSFRVLFQKITDRCCHCCCHVKPSQRLP